jgi:hypothetical protein
MGAEAAGLRGDLAGCQECMTKLGSHRDKRYRHRSELSQSSPSVHIYLDEKEHILQNEIASLHLN